MYEEYGVNDNSGYSPLKSILVKNFNCIDNVEIDMTESPIVCLVGSNECGKTSILDAIRTSIYHDNPNGQKDNIKDDTAGWGTLLLLENDDYVKRVKKKKGGLWEVRKDGKIWSSEKTDSGAGAPAMVEAVMGCIKEKESKELLNVRTYRDLLLFVTTTTGDNYKAMYGALKAENISKAIKKGTEEINKIKSKGVEIESNIAFVKQQLNDIVLHDTTILESIKERVDKREKLLIEMEKAIELKRKNESNLRKLGELKMIVEDKVASINERVMDCLKVAITLREEIEANSNSIERLEKLEECKEVDTEKLNALNRAISYLAEIKRSSAEIEKLKKLDSCNEIDTDKLSILKSSMETISANREVVREYNRVKRCENIELIQVEKVKEIEEALSRKAEYLQSKKASSKYKKVGQCKEIDIDNVKAIVETLKRASDVKRDREDEREKLQKYMEMNREMASFGVSTAECPNCGELVIVS